MSCFEPAAARRREDADLRRARDFQATLLGMAAHDLHQPLQMIQRSREWLGTPMDTRSERTRLMQGETAIAALTEQLDRLAGALRLYQQTRSIEVSPVALAPLFWRVGNESHEAAREKGVELRICSTSAAVMSHPVLLDGMLRNLVRNVVEHTEPGGRILLGCRCRGSDVRIDVYDTGIGMAPQQLPRMFEAIQPLDSTYADGMGIGLFVMRRALERLGHRVEVSSAMGRGARFSVAARASPLPA